MAAIAASPGGRELAAARAEGRGLLLPVFLFSVAVNALMLTGPLFMMQVYDRVLGSGSVETLTALSVLVVFLFAMMFILDLARTRVMTRYAARFQERMEARVFQAALAEGGDSAAADVALRSGLRDLDAIRGLIGSPILLALFDLPFAPLFLAAVWIFHPLLGIVATIGLAVLILTTLANQWLGRAPLQRTMQSALQAERMSDLYRDEGEVIGALGMRRAAFDRWKTARDASATAAVAHADLGGGFTVFSRTFRLFLQSALLAAGAWLVLRQAVSPGAMIASSVLMGRALAPIEQVVGGWSVVQRAQDAWGRLAGLLSRRPERAGRTALPRPEARLEVNQLSVVPPGAQLATLRGVSFTIAPGQAMGVIGPSGSGKTTLAKALIGAWPITAGTIRLGGATLDQYDPDVYGAMVGYLPQRVTLFDGTLAENISRLAGTPDAARVVEAAQAAGAQQMILDLPQGYDTRVSQTGGRLSGGQIQRIGLARALYNEPVLFVLDEPNSNLDNDGSQALNAAIRAIKARGGSVIIMAHRPAAITECELLLMLDGGTRRAFGPREEVLKAMVRNAEEVARIGQTGTGIA